MASKRSGAKPRAIDAQMRVILPPEVLQALDLEAGDFVGFELDGSDVRLRKVRWAPDRRA